MLKQELLNKLNLTGEVIEIYEKDEQKIAKVFIQSLCLEVSIDSIVDVHLSDKLILETDIKFDKVKKALSVK